MEEDKQLSLENKVQTMLEMLTKRVQEELNRLYLGRDFDLASRYVAAQVTIFVCFGFSAALPVLLPLLLLPPPLPTPLQAAYRTRP